MHLFASRRPFRRATTGLMATLAFAATACCGARPVRAQQAAPPAKPPAAAPFLRLPLEYQPPLLSSFGEAVWAIGEARHVTNLKGLAECEWRPDGRAVALLARMARNASDPTTAQKQAAREERALRQGRLPSYWEEGALEEAVLVVYDVASARSRTVRKLPFDLRTAIPYDLFWVGNDAVALRISETHWADKEQRKPIYRERLYIASVKTGKITSASDVPTGLWVEQSPVAPVAVGYKLDSGKPGDRQAWRAWRNGAESRVVLPADKSGNEARGYSEGWDKDGRRLYVRLEIENKPVVAISFDTKAVSVVPAPADWSERRDQGDPTRSMLGAASDRRRREPFAQPTNGRTLYVATGLGERFINNAETADDAPALRPVSGGGDAMAGVDTSPNPLLRYDLAFGDNNGVYLAPGAKAVLYTTSGAVFVRPLYPVAAEAVEKTLTTAEARYLLDLLQPVTQILDQRRRASSGEDLTSEGYRDVLATLRTKENRYYLDRFVWINKDGVIGAVEGKRVRVLLKEYGAGVTVELTAPTGKTGDGAASAPAALP